MTRQHADTQLKLHGAEWTAHIEEDGAQLGVVVESGKHPSGCRGREHLTVQAEQLSIRIWHCKVCIRVLLAVWGDACQACCRRR